MSIAIDDIVKIENKIRWLHGYLIASKCAPLTKDNLDKISQVIEELYMNFNEF